jgi:hypothetical protein
MDGMMIKRVPALAAAQCLRAMDRSDLGGIIAAALALRQVMSEGDSTLTEFAGWIEGWDKFDRQVEETIPDVAREIAHWAMRAQLNPDEEAAAAAEVLAEQRYAHGDDGTDVDSDRRKHAE